MRKKFIEEKQGLGVAGASKVYLGYIGELSPNKAQKVLPILLNYVEIYLDAPKKSTIKRVERLIKKTSVV